ncbi:SDR family NAD(P)-dependent oxidoreductase [Streptomyces antibioticus]|uniref:SDR family NAD(P)-dependent oxidoreductase n=1 Tax=Streptomyces antibioticus TaxID=1890 RepID=UPI0036B11FE6
MRPYLGPHLGPTSREPPLNQPVAWITGASSGIGTAVARRLAREGHIAYGTARRLERLGDLEAEGVRALALDVTDDATTRALDRIIEEQGRIDVLVDNAGYGSYGALEDVPADEGHAQFEVNVFAPARPTQPVLPHIRSPPRRRRLGPPGRTRAQDPHRACAGPHRHPRLQSGSGPGALTPHPCVMELIRRAGLRERTLAPRHSPCLTYRHSIDSHRRSM